MIGGDGFFLVQIKNKRLAIFVAQEQTVVFLAGLVDHKPGRVGIAGEEFKIDFFSAQKFMKDRHHEQAIGAGANAHPLIRNG